MPLSTPVLIGTHHKTGTVWMKNVFSAFADEFGYGFHNVEVQPDYPEQDLLFAPHSRFTDELKQRDFRGLHLIRDPRDMVLSGVRYHLDSGEKWLRQPRESLGGRSYQESLAGLPPEEQFKFELEHLAVNAFHELASWSYDDKRFFELRYEDLIVDETAAKFRMAAEFLPLAPREVDAVCQLFIHQSLFNPRIRRHMPRHIRDGSARQWSRQMSRQQGEWFVSVAGDLLIALGYEKNHDWVLDLPSQTTSTSRTTRT